MDKRVKNLLNTISKLHSISTGGSWSDYTLDDIKVNYDLLKMCKSVINECVIDDKIKELFLNDANESMFILNDFILCSKYKVVEDEPVLTEGESAVKEQIVYRYREVDRDVLEDSERRRKSHFLEIDSLKNKCQRLLDINRVSEEKLIDSKKEIQKLSKDNKDLSNKLNKITSAFRGVS